MCYSMFKLRANNFIIILFIIIICKLASASSSDSDKGARSSSRVKGANHEETTATNDEKPKMKKLSGIDKCILSQI